MTVSFIHAFKLKIFQHYQAYPKKRLIEMFSLFFYSSIKYLPLVLCYKSKIFTIYCDFKNIGPFFSFKLNIIIFGVINRISLFKKAFYRIISKCYKQLIINLPVHIHVTLLKWQFFLHINDKWTGGSKSSWVCD